MLNVEEEIEANMAGNGTGPCPVQVTHLKKVYDQGSSTVIALDDVSFSADRGEFIAVIGPSGSGKSTLLHLLAGLTTPSNGTVEIDGRNLAALKDRELTLFRRKQIGVVFQSYNLIPTFTVEDNVGLPILMDRGSTGEREKVAAALKFLGLIERRKHRPDQLSGGEQQRVAIGRAMINDPTVILADEPTGNLDSVNSRKVCELMRRLCEEEKRTIIAVTHDPAVAIWAHRALIFKDGRMIETVKTADFSTPRELGDRFLVALDQNRSLA